MKQVRIYDRKDGAFHGGILLDDGSVVCGCCGGVFSADEVSSDLNKTNESITHFIVEEYKFWVDLDAEICGDDLGCENEASLRKRYEAIYGKTTNQFWVRDRYKNIYIKPPKDILDMVMSVSDGGKDLARSADYLWDIVATENPSWLKEDGVLEAEI